MEKTTVRNLTLFTQHVGVIHDDGKSDAVQIVPRGLVELREGMTVDPAWLGLNIKAVKITSPQPLRKPRAPAAPVPAIPVTTQDKAGA